MILKNKNLSYKIGLVLAAFHFLFFILWALDYLPRTHLDHTGQSLALSFGIFFIIDWFLKPLSTFAAVIFALFAGVDFLSFLLQLIFVYGIGGTLSWFFIPILISKLYKSLLRKIKNVFLTFAISVLFILLSLFILKAICSFLDDFTTGTLPGRKTNTLSLSKTLFLKDERLGSVTDIVGIESVAGFKIGIAGRKGALFVDRSAKVKSSVIFDQEVTFVEIIDVEGDRMYEYLDRGGHGWQDPSLIDHKGKTIWAYKGKGCGINDMSSGDLDGDGTLDFVVGFNGGVGVHLLDRNGTKQWSQSDTNVNHVDLVDIDVDGGLEIVHSNVDGNMIVRNKKGEIISKNKLSFYFSNFSVCNWPTKEDQQYVLAAGEGKIWVLDFEGKAVMELEASGCDSVGDIKAVPIKFKEEEHEYFAVINEVSHQQGRSILYIYDSKGELVYKEVFRGGFTTVAAISLDNLEVETLFVGGEGEIWQYGFKKER
ncbi:hypothetical protein ACFL96_14795 [Thermoproteota archaeon]